MITPSTVLLTGKVAVVTGGGGGIGKAISLAYAAYGAKVVIAEIDATRTQATAAEIEKLGGQALPIVVDVRIPEQVQLLTQAALKAYGHVDILVNNVGAHPTAMKPFVESTEAEWDSMYHINLRQLFLCTKALAPHIIQHGRGGSIINVSTIEAFRALPQMAAYVAFKGGVTQFTKALALELGQYHIRVNALAPEQVANSLGTPGRNVLPHAEGKPKPDWDRLGPYWYPIGRDGTADDMAGAAVFLASDLSQYITGTTIHLDGGSLAAGGWYRTQSGRFILHPPHLDEIVEDPYTHMQGR